MLFRNATISDTFQMQIVRNAVKENVLSDPALVPDKDYVTYLTERGKGWVCEIDNQVVGFAIADLLDHNVWALFLLPEWEGKGIGKQLHNLMLGWYFQQTKETLWLGTAFNTRAEKFYRQQGWQEAGLHGKEIKFEMTYDSWKLKQAQHSSKHES
jgi:GNAT superfamily N-acetyltransferase